MEARLFVEMARSQHRHAFFRYRRELLAAVLVHQGLDRPLRILDVGAGMGANVPVLARFGTVDVLEPDADAAQVLHRIPGIGRVVSRPDAVQAPEGGYDLICFLDVLEHIEDDVGMVSWALDRLRPGGRLLATVPAHPWLYSDRDRAHHHVRRYTARRLQSILARSSLAELRIQWTFAMSFPGLILDRLLTKLLPSRASQDDLGRQARSGWHGALARMLAVEARLVGRGVRLPIGGSLVAIATTGSGR